MLANPDGSIEDVWITGGHYNFLNYTRMERTDESSVIVTEHGATAKRFIVFLVLLMLNFGLGKL